MDSPKNGKGAPTKSASPKNGHHQDDLGNLLDSDRDESKILRERFDALLAEAREHGGDVRELLNGEPVLWNEYRRRQLLELDEPEPSPPPEDCEDEDAPPRARPPQPEHNPSFHANQILDDGMGGDAAALGLIIAQLFLSCGIAYASVDNLAKRIKKRPKFVSHTLNEMEQRGHLEIVRRNGKPNTYKPIFKRGHTRAMPPR
jgi:hypothetical protein